MAMVDGYVRSAALNAGVFAGRVDDVMRAAGSAFYFDSCGNVVRRAPDDGRPLTPMQWVKGLKVTHPQWFAE